LGDWADVNQCCRKGGWVAERHGRTKYKHSTDRGSCIQFALVQLGKREPVVIANRGQLQGRKLRQFILCDRISPRRLPPACLAFGAPWHLRRRLHGIVSEEVSETHQVRLHASTVPYPTRSGSHHHRRRPLTSEAMAVPPTRYASSRFASSAAFRRAVAKARS
jgi:hypothetical protein